MKKIMVITIIVAFAACKSKMNEEAVKAEVKQIVLDRSQALVKGDAAKMNSILADNFTYKNTGGTVLTKAEYLKYYVGEEKDFEWVSQDLENINVNLKNDTAYVTFSAREKTMRPSNVFDDKVNSTFAYVNTDKTWKCISGESVKAN